MYGTPHAHTTQIIRRASDSVSQEHVFLGKNQFGPCSSSSDIIPTSRRLVLCSWNIHLSCERCFCAHSITSAKLNFSHGAVSHQQRQYHLFMPGVHLLIRTETGVILKCGLTRWLFASAACVAPHSTTIGAFFLLLRGPFAFVLVAVGNRYMFKTDLVVDLFGLAHTYLNRRWRRAAVAAWCGISFFYLATISVEQQVSELQSALDPEESQRPTSMPRPTSTPRALTDVKKPLKGAKKQLHDWAKIVLKMILKFRRHVLFAHKIKFTCYCCFRKTEVFGFSAIFIVQNMTWESGATKIIVRNP